ncbi:hypothetical protein NBT05_02990 [Aquimarina sp. ERC-38]|uniref:hypothetical protein n=1 Tax=Aquimarina sp. ERC-38 TaxID=2949996 RepID=UPI002247E2F6|nr:hypothetical protein [Aquimarina sp. ERC-38]UZO81447.1 hypothetical protein NBT05_02990 [Aquimarina sp. ERC-38]
MKIYRFFEIAYLAAAVFFGYEAYKEWGAEGSRSYLYLFFVAISIFMFFFKRSFRKKIDAQKRE